MHKYHTHSTRDNFCCKLKNWEVALLLRTKFKKKFCVGIVLKIGDCEEGRGAILS